MKTVGRTVPNPRVAASVRIEAAAAGRKTASSREAPIVSAYLVPSSSDGKLNQPITAKVVETKATGARMTATVVPISSGLSAVRTATNRVMPVSAPSVATASTIKKIEVITKTAPASDFE